MLTPLFAGRLVDALSTGLTNRAAAWHAALVAFGTLAALGLGATVLRQGVYLNIITLTLKMMSEIAAASFHRVQRFDRLAREQLRGRPCARSRAASGRSTC